MNRYDILLNKPNYLTLIKKILKRLTNILIRKFRNIKYIKGYLTQEPSSASFGISLAGMPAENLGISTSSITITSNYGVGTGTEILNCVGTGNVGTGAEILDSNSIDIDFS